MAEQSEPIEEAGGGHATPADDASDAEQSRSTPRIPPPNAAAHEIGKRYLFARDGRRLPLVVTVSDGPVRLGYAPAELVGKLAERVAALLKDMGGGFAPMLYAAVPGNSMTLAFGDPDPLASQGQLPVEITLVEARRVADVIELEDDELYARALQIGRPMRQYSELAQFVQSEGVTLTWDVRDFEPRFLTPDRAQRQHARLSAPVITIDRPLTVNGVLYRVITESTREGYFGSAGIHLHSWSARPPGDRKLNRIISFYEKQGVEDGIKAGLIGEPVEARVLIRQPAPGTSIDPDRFDLNPRLDRHWPARAEHRPGDDRRA